MAKLDWQKQTRRGREAKGVQRHSLNSLSIPSQALRTLPQSLPSSCSVHLEAELDFFVFALQLSWMSHPPPEVQLALPGQGVPEPCAAAWGQGDAQALLHPFPVPLQRQNSSHLFPFLVPCLGGGGSSVCDEARAQPCPDVVLANSMCSALLVPTGSLPSLWGLCKCPVPTQVLKPTKPRWAAGRALARRTAWSTWRCPWIPWTSG